MSARSALEWPYTPPAVPCSVHVRIPLIDEVAPGFARACELRCGSDRYPLSVSRLGPWQSLDGYMELAAPHAEIELVTPEIVGAEHNGRLAGIAVPLRAGGADNVVGFARRSASAV